jgi:magnesium transporter
MDPPTQTQSSGNTGGLSSGPAPAQLHGQGKPPPRRRKNHRGGKKKKMRRMSFAAVPDDMAHDTLHSEDGLEPTGTGFYSVHGGNMSNTSIDSETLLDHR